MVCMFSYRVINLHFISLLFRKLEECCVFVSPVQCILGVSTLPKQKYELSQPSTCRSNSDRRADVTTMAQCMCIVILSSIVHSFIMAVIPSCNVCSIQSLHEHIIFPVSTASLHFLGAPGIETCRCLKLYRCHKNYLFLCICLFTYLLVHLPDYKAG